MRFSAFNIDIFKMMTVVILCFFRMDAINAQPLSPINPKFDAFVHTETVGFQWNELIGATYYSVVLSTDPQFTSNVVNSPNIQTTNWVSPLLTWGIWYWKIVGSNGSQEFTSATYQFNHFIPSNMTNLSLWLDPDVGLTVDGNGRVESWLDQSSNGYILTQSDASKRPLLVTSSFNGMPALNFQGTHFLNGGDILDLGTNSRSAFVLGNFGGNNQTFFAKSNGVVMPSRYAFMRFGSQTTLIYQETSDNHLFCPISSTNFALFNWQNNRTTSLNSIFLNNTNIGIKSLSPTHNMQSPVRFLIGAFNGSNDVGEQYFLNGHISELVFIDGFNAQQQLDIQKYFKYKYLPVLDLGIDTVMPNFCQVSLSVTPGYSNISWNTGDVSTSISVSEDGIYSVQGTDMFGFVTSDTVAVYYPTIPQPLNSGICINQSNTWSADMGAGFTYLWSTGETTPSIDITTPGTYNVTVFDAFGCSRNSGDFTFTIDNYEQTAFLGNDTILCSGNNVALQVGAPETVEYFWNGVSSSAQSPFYVVTSSQEVTLESVNVNGCVARDTMLVTVSGTAPVAAFSLSNVCHEDATIFTDLSVPAGSDPIATWLWDFGNGDQSNEQSPSFVYPDPGTYSVELYVLSEGGCGEFATGTVTVFDNPTANFSFTGYCEGKTIQFSNNAVPGDAPITEYFWDFDMPWTGAYNNSTIPIPNRVFDDEGTYDVMFVVTDDNNCDDTLIAPVQISNSPETSFTIENGCQGIALDINNSTIADAGSTYAWDFGDNTTSILPEPVKIFTNYSDYTVTLQVVGPNGCDASAQQIVTVYANPIAAMEIGPACAGSPLSLTDLSNVWGSEIDSVYWLINEEDTLYGSTVLYDLQQLGQQQVEVFAISEQGCSANANEFIEVTETLSASFDASPNIAAGGDPFTFVNTSEGVFLSQWSFGDGGTSFDENPTHTYPIPADSATYSVSLVLINLSGCTDTVTQQMLVLRPVTDLKTEEIYYDGQNGSSVVGVRMVNSGSSVLGKAVLTLESSKGELVTETWTGLLPAGQDSIYVFTSQPNILVSSDDLGDSFVCVESIGYNLADEPETDLSNNKGCLNIEGQQAVLLPFYPNPITDVATVELLITSTSELGLHLTDSRGRLIREFIPTYTALSPGIYSYTISASDLLKGVYYLSMRTKDGKGQTLKVMIND